MLQYEPTVLAENLPSCQRVSACDQKFGSVSQYCPCYLMVFFCLVCLLLFFLHFSLSVSNGLGSITLCLSLSLSLFFWWGGGGGDSSRIPVCFSDLGSTRNECFALSEEKLRKEKGKHLYIVYSLLSAVVQVFFNCSGFSLVEASEAGRWFRWRILLWHYESGTAS